jgi:ATP-binding cassette subfamily B multidrug efflux pump
MLVLIIIGLACAVIAQYIAAKTSQGFGTELRNKLFSHVLKLSNKQIEKYGTSAIVNRITNDILNLEVAVAMFIRLVIRVPFIFIGSLIMVYVLDSTISKILFVSTVILAVCIYVIIKKASKYQQKANTKLDEIALKVKENLLNIRLVKSFGTEKLEEQKFQKSNNENYKLSQKANIFSNLLNPVSVVILDFTIVLVLYIGGIKISNNYMPQGNLIAIIDYISQMILAVIVLSNLITIYTKSFVSYKRIKEILQETPEKDDEEKNIKINNGKN